MGQLGVVVDASNTEIFKYRNTTIKLYRIIFWTLVVICLIMIRINLVNYLEKNWIEIVIKLVLSISLPLSMIFRMQLFIKPRIFASYVLGNEKLMQRYKNRIREIEFKNIESIQFSMLSPRFFGGFIVKLKSGPKFMFLSLLPNNHVILEKIIESRPELLSSDRVKAYVTISRLVEISWGRIIKRIRNLPLSLTKLLVYPLVIAIILYEQNLFRFFHDLRMAEAISYYFAIVWLVNALVALVINIYEEKFLNKRVNIASDGQLKVDEVWEKRVVIAAEALFYVVTILLYFFKNFF